MKRMRGNIWDFVERKYHITIPVNVGWTSSSPKRNIMGRGLALDAKERYQGCDRWLGEEQLKCWNHWWNHTDESLRHTCHPEFIILYPHAPLIFFPTKELNKRKPWKSWASKSKKPHIMRMLDFFPSFADKHGLERIVVPLLGSGAGGLDPIDMAASIKKALNDDDRFTLVTPAYI